MCLYAQSAYCIEQLSHLIKNISVKNKVPFEVVKFWTDISQLQNMQIPAYNIGPGSIDQAHSDDEYIILDELKYISTIFYDLIFKNEK